MDGLAELAGVSLEGAVDAYLRANPGFLAARPDLYRALTPPCRVHGEAVADHLTAMVRRERLHAHAMTQETQAVLTAGRQAAAAGHLVHEAVLAMMQAPDAAECLVGEVPRLLGADAVCLARHDGATPDLARRDGATPELARALETALGGAEVRPRTAPADVARCYAEAAGLVGHDVLIRLPGVGVLGLGFRAARDPLGGPAEGDWRRHLAFLGRAAAVLLRPVA